MPNKLTSEEFTSKAMAKHNGKYLYTRAVYVNSHTPLTVTCPIHGDFTILPNSHLSVGSGCQVCSKEAPSPLKKTTACFIEEAKAVHGNTFDYTLSKYDGALSPITVIHKLCGREWVTTPTVILRAKTCNQCSVEAMVEAKRVKNEKKREDFEATLGSDYKVLTPYKKAKEKITVQHICGYVFSSTPDNLLRKNQCPGCTKYGFKPDTSAVLYYLEIDNGQAYKIGITNNTVAERYLVKDLKTIRILYTWTLPIGRECRELERYILEKYSDSKYLGPPLLSSGNSELFTHDILNLQDIPYEHDRAD
jgi:hypothetical protein